MRKPAKEPKQAREPVSVTVYNSKTVQEDETGKPIWRIFAAKTNINEAKGQAAVKNGRVEVFTKGKHPITLVFPNLSASAPAKQLQAWGGVQATSPERNTSFKAQSITIDLKADRLTATGGVRGSNDTGTFEADTLESDLKFKHMRLSSKGKVRGTIGLTVGKGPSK